jgi:hypothetical protein
MPLTSLLRHTRPLIAFCAMLLAPVAASADNDTVFAVKALKYVSGVVNQNGVIVAGKGFAAVRNGVGDYTLTFPAGSFKQFPGFTCTGSGGNGGIPVCNIFNLSWAAGTATTVEIRIWNLSATAQDNSFHFTAIPTR